jgi:hypothetical protein
MDTITTREEEVLAAMRVYDALREGVEQINRAIAGAEGSITVDEFIGKPLTLSSGEWCELILDNVPDLQATVGNNVVTLSMPGVLNTLIRCISGGRMRVAIVYNTNTRIVKRLKLEWIDTPGE